MRHRRGLCERERRESGNAYIPLILIQKVLVPVPTSEKEYRPPDLIAPLRYRSSLLDEAAERCDARAGTDHDNRLGGIRRQLEVRMADMHRHMDAIVLVPRSIDRIRQTMGIRMLFPMLSLLQRKQVIRRHAANDVLRVRDADLLHDRRDRNLLLLHERARGDGVVARLDLVDAFDEEAEWHVGPCARRVNLLEDLCDVEVLGRDLVLEVVLVGSQFRHLRFRSVVGRKGGERVDKLARNGARDFDVVAHGGVVSRWGGEGHACGRVEGFDADDRMALLRETEDGEEAVDFFAAIRGPDGDVVAGLVREVRARDVDFHV